VRRIIIAALATVLCVTAAQGQDSPWPMFRHDRKHTARTPYTGPAVPAVAWTFPVNDGIVSSPSIGSDGTIYFGAGWSFLGSADSGLYAIHPDGTLKWRFTAGDGIFSSPAIGPDGALFFGCIDKSIYAVEDSVTYGKLRWNTNLGNFFVLSSPVVSPAGPVYIGAPSFYFYSLDPLTGAINWSYKTGWCIISSPVIIDDGTVYIGSKDHKLYAFDEDTPHFVWAAPAGTFYDGHLVDASPAVGENGTIYFGTDPYGAAGQTVVIPDTSFWAVNPNGTRKWAFATKNGVESSPAIGADGTIYFGSYDSCLYAVTDNGTAGVLKWKFKTGGPIDGSPTVDGDGIIYVGSRDSTLYAFYPDGNVKWSYPLDGATECSPTIDGRGYLYIGTFAGTLYAFGTDAPDVGVVSLGIAAHVEPGETYTPAALVRNFRAAAQTFDVACTIFDGSTIVYGDTLSVSNATGTRNLQFAAWPVGPDTGTTYTVTVTTLLAGDDNGDNDQKVVQTVAAGSQFTCGDANGDNLANVGDAVFLINFVFRGGAPPSPLAAGDANCDGQANVGDAVYMINFVFRGGAIPCAVCP
jgi:outer membrane protein assembly factor BamB